MSALKSNRSINYAILLLSLLPITQAALAREDAGRLDKRFEKPPESKSTNKPFMFPLQEQLPPDQAGKIKFTLKEIRLTGNTAFSNQELAELYQPLLGKEISLLDIYKIRDAITQKYGNAGFGLSKAIVPNQHIQSQGIVTINIIEGFVDEIIIEGATDAQQSYLAYAAEQIKAERPLNAKTLERYLLLANDRFAIKVTATMKPSEKTPAASTLILKVETAPKIEGGTGIDNRGTKTVGPWQINSHAAVNGLFGRASQTTLQHVTTPDVRELQYIAVSHTELLSPEGTTLNFTWSGTKSQPNSAALHAINYQGSTADWALKIAHPFIRTRQENLTTYLKYQARNAAGKSLNKFTMNDNIRTVRVGVNYDFADAYAGINQVLFEYSFGIDGLGSSNYYSDLKSRANGKPDYKKLLIQLSRRQELGYFSPLLSQFSLNAAMMGQYSGNGLLSSEQCGVGGGQFGRAYDYSELLGDSCIAGSIELAYRPDFMQIEPIKYSQFYTFYDGGMTNNTKPLNINDARTKTLMSTGVGFRFGLTDYLSGSIEGDFPLTRVVANQGNKDPRVFGSFSVRF